MAVKSLEVSEEVVQECNQTILDTLLHREYLATSCPSLLSGTSIVLRT